MTAEIYRPLLSVVMAVYNGGKYLAEGIESILNQTFVDFEFLIINDGSVDETEYIIKKYAQQDKRIIYLKNEVNLGQSKSWNCAIKKARGKFIARVDADDISFPQRFKKQYEYMLLHPDIGVLGTNYYVFFEDQKSKTKRKITNHITDGQAPVHHPTCLIRKELFENFGYYNSKYDNAEDGELWYRFYAAGIKFANLDDYLLSYRIHKNNVSIRKIKKQVYLQLKINLIAVFRYKIKFSVKGYLRILEQIFYFAYLSLRLNKIYTKNGLNLS